MKYAYIMVAGVLSLSACSGDGTEFLSAAESNNLRLASLTITQPAGLLSPLYINAGDRVPLSLSGISRDNEFLELSPSSKNWSIDAAFADFASIDNNGVFTAIADSAEPVVVRVAIGGVNSTFNIFVQTESLASISEIRGPATLERCLPQNYTAVGTFSQGSTRGLPQATWSVANPLMGRVGENFEGSIPVTGVNTLEPLQLVASVDGVTFTQAIIVDDNLKQIIITPDSIETTVDGIVSLGATGTYTTGESERSVVITEMVEWQVSFNNGIATVENEDPKGQLTGESAGTTLVSASCGDFREEQSVVVQ